MLLEIVHQHWCACIKKTTDNWMKQVLYLLLLLLPLLLTLYIQFLFNWPIFLQFLQYCHSCRWWRRSLGWQHHSCDSQHPALAQRFLQGVFYNFSISFPQFTKMLERVALLVLLRSHFFWCHRSQFDFWKNVILIGFDFHTRPVGDAK